MNIRKLRVDDAPFMLEWMQDDEITKHLHKDFSHKTLADVEEFICQSVNESFLHYAVVSDEDEYMGTVSLKNIYDGSAEFAICLRKKALNRGYAWFAMESIIMKGFDELELDAIYWCVSKTNLRAIRFYEKHGFHPVVDMPRDILDGYDGCDDLIWFLVLNGDDINTRESVAGCRIIRIKTVSTINAGELSFFESNKDFEFEIKRIYYISKAPEGTRRGFHAHKSLKQILFCPYGRILLALENAEGREEIELSDPSIGVLIEKPTWREMVWLQKDSVLCVAASDFYSPDDYIRDYGEYKKYLEMECEE